MLKIFLTTLATVLVSTVIFAAAANARDGGAEPMPLTNYTDMPSYQPWPVESQRRIKHVRKHVHRPYRAAGER